MRRISLERGIGADAVHALGQAEPDRAMRLERLGQGAVVDQRVADRLDAARLRSASARTSMQPPAAAATVLCGRFTQANG